MSALDRLNIEAAIGCRSGINPMRWLLRAGVVRPHHNDFTKLRGPFSWGPKHIWVCLWRSRYDKPIGIFRNSPGVVRDVGTWLPRRWGFYILGFEFGQRG